MLFPDVKIVMIDKKEEELFRTITENKGKVKSPLSFTLFL